MERARINTLDELAAEAARFAAGLAPRAAGATLVTLAGELGAGKTAFVKAIAKALGVEETVTSPTFVLERIYPVKPQSGHGAGGLPRAAKGGFTRLVHIDAYRLASGADLAPLGFDEIMRDAENLVFLEWPEKVAGALPAPAARVMLACTDDGAHTIAYGR